MKSRKLFAILTLVAFMMTLLPVAAFAYSAAASTVDAYNTSIKPYDETNADTKLETSAKIVVTLKDSLGAAVTAAGTEIYVKSTRDAEVGVVEFDGGTQALDNTQMGSVDGQKLTVKPDSKGKVTIYVGSKITGTFTIKVYNATGADKGLLIGSADVTVAVGDGSASLTMVNDDTWNSGNGSSATPYKGDVDDAVELKVEMKDGAAAIKDKAVTFQQKYEGGSFYSIKNATTDKDGIAKLYFRETKAGKYEYRVKYDDNKYSNVIFVEYAPGEVSKIEAKTEAGKKFGTNETNTVEFYVKDKFGNLIKSTNNVAKFKVQNAPAGSKYADNDYATAVNSDADGVIKFTTFKPDKEGTYTIRAAENKGTVRVSTDLDVTAVKFEKATGLKFKLKNNEGKEVTALKRVKSVDVVGNDVDEKAGELEVYRVNAAGVEIKVTPDASSFSFASSNIGWVTIGDDGAIKIKKDAKDVTLTVHDKENSLIGTFELKVVGDARGIQETVAVNGKTATVALQYVDANGVKTFATKDEEYAVAAPAGVSVSNVVKFDATGKATFTVNATEYGKYALTVLTGTEKIGKTFEINFVMPASEKPVIGARAVVMFIGATGYVQDGSAKITDVAPFIKDNRTFVAVRPVAEAFGADIEVVANADGTTKTVILKRADLTVTIEIGGVVTKVVDGVTTTVATDVPAFIKDGRTVLPFRAVGEAFGAAVNATFNADGTTASVTFAQ